LGEWLIFRLVACSPKSDRGPDLPLRASSEKVAVSKRGFHLAEKENGKEQPNISRK